MATEKWKKLKIIGPEHWINRAGQVRCVREVRNGRIYYRIRRPSIDPNGVPYLVFHDKGRQQCRKIHRLCAEAYLPNPKNLPCVRFKDRDTGNPAAYNLEWTVRSAPSRRGTGRKLHASHINLIRYLLGAGETQASIARKCGVSPSLRSRIKSGQRW